MPWGVTKWLLLRRRKTNHFTHWRKGRSIHNVPFRGHLTRRLSYKFPRLFPLSQYDLPTHNSGILSFAHPTNRPASEPTRSPRASPQLTMTSEQMKRNPDVDYTTFGFGSSADSSQSDDDHRPDLISLVFSDVGVLTPGGVSQYLVGMFAGL